MLTWTRPDYHHEPILQYEIVLKDSGSVYVAVDNDSTDYCDGTAEALVGTADVEVTEPSCTIPMAHLVTHLGWP